jgi:hypothetical protein
MMSVYEVTIRLGIGSLDLEVEFEDGYEPTQDEIHDAAEREIEAELTQSKLDYYRKIG